MKLSDLIDGPLAADPEISGITCDSRAVRPGYLFAALPGSQADGATFIPAAEAAGAVAVIAEPETTTTSILIAAENPRRAYAKAAARFFSAQPRVSVGITGTNGKTSTAIFTEQLWRRASRRSASIGTLGVRSDTVRQKLNHTTPEPSLLHKILAELAGSDVTHVAMEVSSHALAQYRADGVRFSGAAFTNISQDHLDYHADFEDYFNAKLRLFTELIPEDGFVAVNMDGAGAERVATAAAARKLRLISVGRFGADITLKSVRSLPDGLAIEALVLGETYALKLPLIGAFQAENALLAAALACGSGEAVDHIFASLESLEGAPGRMQFAAAANGAAAYVDYAHTPDAIARALASIRPHASGKVVAIVGAGGDRDRAKRPLMGKAAADGADVVIVTDDNPRTENAASIRAAVLAGCEDALEIGDREKAIAEGLSLLKEGDVLLVMGKGHETGQVVGKDVLPFDDVEVLARLSSNKSGSIDGDIAHG